MSKKTAERNISGSIAEIADIIKVIGHEKRLQILTLVLNEAQDFSSLLANTELQKTALSNHLVKMINIQLIQKVERGKYLITDDGRELLQLISSFYEKASIRKKIERKKLINRYSHGRKTQMEKTLTIKPVYQPCWISYLGSVSGVMKALGKEDHDLVNTGGYTGYAFALPNVAKGSTCPSGPTALGQMWNEIMKGTDTLGYATSVYDDHKCYPAQEGQVTDEDRNRATELFKTVKKAIDRDEPVVLWGIPIPEYGIVTGYQDKNYLVSTFRRLNNIPDNPVAFDALQAPGALHAIIFNKQYTEITAKEDKLTLQRAIILAEGQLTESNYVAGAQAYEEWASVLEKGAELIYHGNAYVNECTREAKAIAAEFLKRLATKYQDQPVVSLLKEAAEEYSKIVSLLTSFREIFPFAMEGEMTEEKRQKGVQILREAIPLEKQALTLLKKVYETWN
ncbi:MAG: ArsR/SmtB family transcription factor [Promethearchaeota archaeon]